MQQNQSQNKNAITFIDDIILLCIVFMYVGS